jgi:hypothetical protein
VPILQARKNQVGYENRWRNRMGGERLLALLQERLAAAARSGAIKPAHLARAIVDTTVQPKNVTFPTDAKLVNRTREKLVPKSSASSCASPMRASASSPSEDLGRNSSIQPDMEAV